MNFLEKLQEKYVAEFSDTVALDEFILNILVTAVLVALLRLFYIRFGRSISNRERFSSNFLPLALGTLLIIMIVKSSIALSLGLVGALSIVRYRAAIKDPEELTYLFIAIGLGLAGGANQPILAVVAFVTILGILYVGKLLQGKHVLNRKDGLIVNIQSKNSDVALFTDLVRKHFSYADLKNMHSDPEGIRLSFYCRADNIEALEAFQKEINQRVAETQFSIIDASNIPQ